MNDYSVPFSDRRAKMRSEFSGLKDKPRDEFFLEHILPDLLDDFCALPLHNQPHNFVRPRFLVSVLGLSWQPVVLTAAWLRPEKMLIVATEDSLKNTVKDLSVLDILRLHNIIPPQNVITRTASNDNIEIDLYRFVREFFTDLQCAPSDLAVEITGGKKTMSAAAALAGFYLGTPILYVDYLYYIERRPQPFSEFISLIRNPLEVFGDIEFDNVIRDFDNGNYSAATALCKELEKRLNYSKEPYALRLLCESMERASAFNFLKARELLGLSLKECDSLAEQNRWKWYLNNRESLMQYMTRLDELYRVSSAPDIGTLLSTVWFGLSQSRALIKRGACSQAALLIYASLERFLKFCLKHYFGVNDKPKFSNFTQKQQFSIERNSIARYGSFDERRVSNKEISFSTAMLLLEALAACDDRAEGERCPVRISKKQFQKISSASKIRHGSQYSHGMNVGEPQAKKVENYFELIFEIVSQIHGKSATEERISSFDLPKLGER